MPLAYRDYQIEAMGECVSELARRDSVLLQAPTGSGKTIMATGITDFFVAEGKRVMFLAPRRELVHQAADKIELYGYEHGRDYGVIMAGVDGGKEFAHLPIQIASKDTLNARLRRGQMDLPRAHLVIVDEAHLSLSPTWRKLLAQYRMDGAKVLGLTATPSRGDGRGLGRLYDVMVQCPSVKELMKMGHLSEATYYAPSQPDLDGIRTDYKKHDFAEGELAERMSQPTIVGDIVEQWQKLAAGRRTVVFCAGVKHSILVRDRFLGQGITAAHVDGSTATAERDKIFEEFRTGDVQVLTNCMVATYGFDLPEMDCVVLARPTQSIVLHLQMLGRGLRVAEGKQDCLVLDHAGNISRMGFADDLVPWSLEDTGSVYARIEEKRKREKKDEGITCGDCSMVYRGQRACPSCGWEPPQKRGKDISVVDGELRRLSADAHTLQQAQGFYLGALHMCRDRGWKDAKAYYMTLEKYGVKAPYSWLNLPTIPPSPEVIGFARYQQIRWAKRRSVA